MAILTKISWVKAELATNQQHIADFIWRSRKKPSHSPPGTGGAGGRESVRYSEV